MWQRLRFQLCVISHLASVVRTSRWEPCTGKGTGWESIVLHSRRRRGSSSNLTVNFSLSMQITTEPHTLHSYMKINTQAYTRSDDSLAFNRLTRRVLSFVNVNFAQMSTAKITRYFRFAMSNVYRRERAIPQVQYRFFEKILCVSHFGEITFAKVSIQFRIFVNTVSRG